MGGGVITLGCWPEASIVGDLDGGFGGGAGGSRYWNTFLPPIRSCSESDFSTRSNRILASFAAGGLAEGFANGVWTAAVVVGSRKTRTIVAPNTTSRTSNMLR